MAPVHLRKDGGAPSCPGPARSQTCLMDSSSAKHGHHQPEHLPPLSICLIQLSGLHKGGRAGFSEDHSAGWVNTQINQWITPSCSFTIWRARKPFQIPLGQRASQGVEVRTTSQARGLESTIEKRQNQGNHKQEEECSGQESRGERLRDRNTSNELWELWVNPGAGMEGGLGEMWQRGVGEWQHWGVGEPSVWSSWG